MSRPLAMPVACTRAKNKVHRKTGKKEADNSAQSSARLAGDERDIWGTQGLKTPPPTGIFHTTQQELGP